ncbi:MAG: glycosyltransferase [Candidatus Methanomethylicia archaeon]
MEDENRKLKRVSIIIPVKNMENSIEDLLKSIMELDYPKDKIEVIIVDGGSNDKTLEIASKYPVKILKEDGKGPNYGRNIGIKTASGEIYAFTDGDCILPKDWLKKIVEKIDDEEVGCVGGSVFVAECLKDNLIAKYADESIMRIMPIAKTTEKIHEVKLFKHLATCNMAVKRKVIEEIGGFEDDLKVFEDIDLIVKICKKGYKVLRSPEIYVWHKHREGVWKLIKQTFNYGRGAFAFLRKRPEQHISKMYTLGIIAFIIYLTIIAAGLIMAINGNLLLLSIILTITLLAYTLDMMYYIVKTKSLRKMILYPILDVVRILSFVSGGVVQLLFGW